MTSPPQGGLGHWSMVLVEHSFPREREAGEIREGNGVGFARACTQMSDVSIRATAEVLDLRRLCEFRGVPASGHPRSSVV